MTEHGRRLPTRRVRRAEHPALRSAMTDAEQHWSAPERRLGARSSWHRPSLSVTIDVIGMLPRLSARSVATRPGAYGGGPRREARTPPSLMTRAACRRCRSPDETRYASESDWSD